MKLFPLISQARLLWVTLLAMQILTGCGAGDMIPSDSGNSEYASADVSSEDLIQESDYNSLQTGLTEAISSRFPDSDARQIATTIVNAIDAESSGSELALTQQSTELNREDKALWAGVMAGSSILPEGKGSLFFLVPQMAREHLRSYSDYDLSQSPGKLISSATSYSGWLDQQAANEIFVQLVTDGTEVSPDDNVWSALKEFIPQSQMIEAAKIIKAEKSAAAQTAEAKEAGQNPDATEDEAATQHSHQHNPGTTISEKAASRSPFPESSVSVQIEETVQKAPGPLVFHFVLTYPKEATEYYVHSRDIRAWFPLEGPDIRIELPQKKSSCGADSVYLNVRDKDGNEYPYDTKMRKKIYVDCGLSNPEPVMKEALVSVPADDGIFMTGRGEDGQACKKNTFAQYQISTKKWKVLKSPPLGTRDSAGAWTGTHLVLAGGSCDSAGEAGMNDDVNHYVQVYDPKTDDWSLVRAPFGNLPRKSHSAVSTGTEVAFFGGTNDGFATNRNDGETGFTFNPVTQDFRDIPPSPIEAEKYNSARYRLAWTGEEVIVVPALTYFGFCCTAAKAVYAWNSKDNSWRYVTENHIVMELVKNTGYHYTDSAGFFKNGRAYIFAHHNQQNNRILSLDPLSGEWSVASQLLPRTDVPGSSILVLSDHVVQLLGHAQIAVMPLNPFGEE